MAKERAELSAKNKYHIDKHRFYELKHFCLQYPSWRHAYLHLDGYKPRATDLMTFKGSELDIPTERTAIEKSRYLNWMEMVEQSAIKADPELKDYILRAVTEGLSYDTLKARLEIPCSRDTYYDRFRRFFWLLSNVRN